MKKTGNRIRLRFQISLLLLIILMLGISTLTILSTVLSITSDVSKKKAEQLFNETGNSIRIKLDNQIEKAIQLSELMSTLPEFTTDIKDSATSHPGLPFLTEALGKNNYFYSIYTGFGNEDFIQLIKTSGNNLILSAHNAPPGTAYILRAINSRQAYREENWTFLDAELRTISAYKNPSPEYLPTNRLWYTEASEKSGKAVMTEPYIFNSLHEPGITVAVSVEKDIVIGIDMTLADLELFINDIFISSNTGIIVADSSDRVLAANRQMKKLLNNSAGTINSFSRLPSKIKNVIEENSPGNSNLNPLNRLTNISLLYRSEWTVPGGQEYQLIITAPAADFLGHQFVIRKRIIFSSVIIFVVVFPLIILTSFYFSRFLKNLAADAENIQKFNFNGDIAEHSPIIEFEELAEAFRIMKKAIASKTQTLENTLNKLEQIIDLGIAMSVEQDSDRIVEMILKGAKDLSGADGGSLYLKGDEDELEFKIVLNDSLGIVQGGTSPTPVTMPSVQLYLDNGKPNLHNVVSNAFHRKETIVVDNAYEDPDYDFSGTKKFDKLNNYRSVSFLTVPLKLQGSDIIGALQLINCRSVDTGNVVPFSKDNQSYIEALSSLAAAILYNRILLDSHNILFESLIRLIATAIDTKSPYTGGHCERVPVLSQMLAKKAEEAADGPLADFRFSSPLEKKAFIMGAWLHDAGKVTTPEFVIDKAVKLETIHNRIHEIRTRFEVMLRDVRLAEKEALIAGKDPETAAAELKKAEEKLFEDFNYIAGLNNGKITLPPDGEARLLEIGSRTWKSHFDHTAGLSLEESEKNTVPYRKGQTIEEPLLADKQQHLIADNEKSRTRYNGFGFILPQPEHLYNRGEIHNLLIKNGTLTEEERFKINEHIMQTIVMLDSLPFPSGMGKITEFGGTHHETLAGTGYPRGLKGDELSIPARIITIADIFEALTASDRPYKKPKKLSEAVKILHQMKLAGNIDPDLFNLFLQSGVYLEYAERFLPPEMIDEVDIEQFI